MNEQILKECRSKFPIGSVWRSRDGKKWEIKNYNINGSYVINAKEVSSDGFNWLDIEGITLKNFESDTDLIERI